MKYDTIRKSLIGATLLVLAYVSAGGHVETAFGKLGAGRISEYNDTYLKTSFDTSMKGFLILSGIKSGLAIIEGSEVGVGFNLELGDVVQSVYDYVDVAWRTALTGGTILLLSQLILQVVGLINHWCLGILFLLLFILYLLNLFSKAQSGLFLLIKNMTAFLIILTVALYCLLPVSIRGAAWLSSHITNPLIDEAHEGFSSVKKEMSPEALSDKFFSDDTPADGSWFSKLNINKHYETAKKQFAELGFYLKHQVENIAVWTIKLIAGYLFDCLIFPVTFFLLLYIFTKLTMTHIFEMRFIR